jgi:uncharacterized protein (DUF736 family)
MPVIGTFKADKDGYAGTIRTLSVNAKVRIVANDRKSGAARPTSASLPVRWRSAPPGARRRGRRRRPI